MKKFHYTYQSWVIFISLLTLNCITVHGQTKKQIENFLFANVSKNWIGSVQVKADGDLGDSIQFIFYRNGKVVEKVLMGDDWKNSNGTWRLYKTENTWMMDIIEKTFRIQPHFAKTDENEKLILLDNNDFNAGRPVKVFTLRANGFK